MNSKKNKKNVDVRVEDSIPQMKKNEKRKIQLTNENANIENKAKKRKNLDTEISTTPPKRAKKKKAVENITEPLLSNDDIENVPSTKKLKQNSHIISDMQNENPEFDETIKKNKRKNPKTEKTLDVPTLEPSELVEDTNLIKIENNIANDSKPIIHHELNIIDIKGENVNDNVVQISIKDVEGFDSDWDENDLLKQLERRIEKKESPKERKADIDWPDDDLKELVARMELGLPENDLKPFMKRADSLEWDKIAFKNYSSDDCKKTWSLIIKKIRRYRILKEVLQDAKEWISVPRAKKKPPKPPRHPDMPRRPLSAYFIYYLKKKDSLHAEHPRLDATELAKMCSQKFKLIPSEKRLKYEKIANKNKEEYDQKMKEFYEKYPEFKLEKEAKSKKLPKPPKPPKPVVEKPPPKPPKPPKEKVPKRPLNAFQYYHLSELSKEQVEDKAAFKELCKERWKQMPDDKKIEWISYAEAETLKYEEALKEYIKNHPEYVHTSQNKPQLTKEELLVKERLSGKPPKPPVSSYNLFARILLHSDDIKNVPVKDRLVFVSNQWKECTDEEKKQYKELFDKEIEKYNKDYITYLDSLPEEERKLELEKNGPKRRKSDEEKKKSKSKKPIKKKSEVNNEQKKTVTNAPNSTSKKGKKKPKQLVEPEQPPISSFKYFASIYTGEEPVAKVWKNLSPEEKKKYEDELVQKKKAYILDFEKFLKSMSKEELENYSNSRKKQNNQKTSEDEDSDQSDSEEDSNDDESDEEEQDN